jgi:hypothetical protein
MSKLFELVYLSGLRTRFSKLGEIIGNLENFWGKSLMKLEEFTINLAKIRKKSGEIELNWGRVRNPGICSQLYQKTHN